MYMHKNPGGSDKVLHNQSCTREEKVTHLLNSRQDEERLRLSDFTAPNHGGFGRSNRKCSRISNIQLALYNFLERPAGFKSIIYHVFIFVLVLLCLLFNVLTTLEGEPDPFYVSSLLFMEIVLLVILGLEYLGRLWSAGCISKYKRWAGRLRFMKRVICILDLLVLIASITILVFGRNGNMFAASYIRGIRFLQILRMLRVDRQGGTWQLVGSVIYSHRRELMTTMYIGFLSLIFCSYSVYLAEKPSIELPEGHEHNAGTFHSYADALWWGVVTVTTIGYGDQVPRTWLGKAIASFFSVFAISFFALPAGILGSGFALKVQQNQRKRKLSRRVPAAAYLVQATWRWYATLDKTSCAGTWRAYSSKQKRRETLAESARVDAESAPRSPNIGDGINVVMMPHDLKYMPEATNPANDMSEPYKKVVRAVRKFQFFAAKKNFQLSQKPYEVHDVVEQYSQGHAVVVNQLKALQRRLDDTLKRPKLCSNEQPTIRHTDEQRQQHTAVARLQSLDEKVSGIERKLDAILERL